MIDGFSGVTDAGVPKAAVVLTRSATLKNGNKLPDERFVYVFTLDAQQKITQIELYAPLRNPLGDPRGRTPPHSYQLDLNFCAYARDRFGRTARLGL